MDPAQQQNPLAGAEPDRPRSTPPASLAGNVYRGPKERAIEYAEQLADALEQRREAEAHRTEFDRSVFLAFVRRGKSRPGLQGRDQDLFRAGLALAIRES